MQFTIDTSQVVRLADVFTANAKQMRQAEVTALNKTLRWLSSRVAKTASKELKIAAKIIRQRMAVYKATRRARQGRFWVGLNPMQASRLGKFRQLKRGVKVGRYRFDGAFLTAMANGHTGIFERTGEAKRTMKSGRYAGTNTKREPIREVEVDLNTMSLQEEITKLFAAAQAQFFVIYKQELNYQVFVKHAH